MTKARIQIWLGLATFALVIALSVAMTASGAFASVPASGAQSSPAKQAQPSGLKSSAPAPAGSNKQASKPANPLVVLYDQYDNVGANGTSAQNFEAANDAFDDMAADDFVIPSGPNWIVQNVEIRGFYSAAGPVATVNLVFHADNGSNLPGAVVTGGNYPSQAYTNGANAGDLVVTLSPGPLTLPPGHYWMEVQANMNFSGGIGQWYWLDRTVQSNAPAAWQNPGDGFGTGCTAWAVRGSGCANHPEQPDFVYRLNGALGPTPTGVVLTDTPTNTWTVTRTNTPLSTPTCLPQFVMIDASKQKPGEQKPGTVRKPANSKFGSFADVAVRDNPGQATYMAPDSSFEFRLDDGTREASYAFSNGVTESAAVWLNRFSTSSPITYPLTIQNISIYWPTQGANDATFITETARLLVYFDPTPDGVPDDGWLISGLDHYVTVGVTNTFRTYNINPGITVITPTGDIYIGFEDMWAEGGTGYSPLLHPGATDTTLDQGRSLLIGNGDGSDPNLLDLSQDTFEAFLPGNLMIRATGDDNRAPHCAPTSTPLFSNTPTYTHVATSTSTPTKTPPPCGPHANYTYTQSTGASLKVGTDLVAGSQADDANVVITLPFAFSFYGEPAYTALASTNGMLAFTTITAAFINSCMPVTTMDDIIAPHWDDLDMSLPLTGTSTTPGIYTSVVNSAPNRIFTIEWRGCLWASGSCGGQVNFEVRLYENGGLGDKFDIIYGTITNGGTSATVGVQQHDGLHSNHFTQYECNSGGLSSGLMLAFSLPQCVTATPTCPPVARMPQTIGLNNKGQPNLVKNGNGPNKLSSSGLKVKSAPVLSPTSPQSPINLILDDGSYDTSIGFGTATTETAAIWLNRFSPGSFNLPMTINSISIFWPTQTTGSLIGLAPRLLVYQDTDGNNDPSNATLLGAISVTIGITGAFQTYPVSVAVPALTGDIYIGFEDAWAEGGYTPRYFPAAQDTTDTQVRSWTIGMGTGANPDYNNLGNNDSIGVIDQFGLPGNWMIRATGNTADRFCPTATPAPSGVITGHLTWDGISQTPPPDVHNIGITATLILTSGGVTRFNQLVTTADSTAHFTVTTGLANGTYTYWIKNIMSLANGGSLSITGVTSNVEFGPMRAGDCNDSNNVNAVDFTILKNTFGKARGAVGYDERANFNRDTVVNAQDFNLLKTRFGQAGAPH